MPNRCRRGTRLLRLRHLHLHERGWERSSRPAFDGSTPLQVVERGETDRIWRMVYELESGEPARPNPHSFAFFVMGVSP